MYHYYYYFFPPMLIILSHENQHPVPARITTIRVNNNIWRRCRRLMCVVGWIDDLSLSLSLFR